MRKSLLVMSIISVISIAINIKFVTSSMAEQTVAVAEPMLKPFLSQEKIVSEATPSTSESIDTSEGANDTIVTTPQPVHIDVLAGDSLTSIAEKYQVTYKRLYDANSDIVHPDIINPGQRIRIPTPDEVFPSRALPEIQRPTEVASAPTVIVTSSAPAVAGGSVWDQLAKCESGGNWSINTGNGYYGGVQFSLPTWRGVGGSGLPSENSREEQIARAEILLARSGWGQWPACSAKLGLR